MNALDQVSGAVETRPVAHEPAGWRASATFGLCLGAPIAGAVLLLGNRVDDSLFDAVLVWVFFAPACAGTLAVTIAVVIGVRGWPLDRWWWATVLPPGLCVLLFAGSLAGGPSGSTRERAIGWAAVTVTVCVGVALAAGLRVRWPVRVLAVVVALAATPAMVGFDHASQHRWREAEFAASPGVLPVIDGYRPVAAWPEPGGLQIYLAGPVGLMVDVDPCGSECAAPGPGPFGSVTFVADGYELNVYRTDVSVNPVPGLTAVGIRPASRAELARLKRGPDFFSD